MRQNKLHRITHIFRCSGSTSIDRGCSAWFACLPVLRLSFRSRRNADSDKSKRKGGWIFRHCGLTLFASAIIQSTSEFVTTLRLTPDRKHISNKIVSAAMSNIKWIIKKICLHSQSNVPAVCGSCSKQTLVRKIFRIQGKQFRYFIRQFCFWFRLAKD